MENYTTIQVQCDEKGYGITTCPFIYKTEKVLVGGYFCSFFCKYYKGRNQKEKQVYCKLSLDDFVELKQLPKDLANFNIDEKKIDEKKNNNSYDVINLLQKFTKKLKEYDYKQEWEYNQEHKKVCNDCIKQLNYALHTKTGIDLEHYQKQLDILNNIRKRPNEVQEFSFEIIKKYGWYKIGLFNNRTLFKLGNFGLLEHNGSIFQWDLKENRIGEEYYTESELKKYSTLAIEMTKLQNKQNGEL